MKPARWMGVVFLLGAMLPSVAQASTPTPRGHPFLGDYLREVRVLYPLEIAGWRAQDEHRYDQPEAGVSVRYTRVEAPDAPWIDVFLYPVGTLDGDEARGLAQGEFDALLQHWRDGGRTVDAGTLEMFDVPVPGRAAPLHAYVATSRLDDGAMRHPVIAVAADRLYAIKLRYSPPADVRSREDAEQDVRTLFEGLLARLQVHGTGRCGDDLPVRAVKSPPPSESVLATHSDARGVAAWLTVDGVLALDPASVEAQALRALGMGLLDRRAPGCVGVDPVNPLVDEGMREIRIEYRLP